MMVFVPTQGFQHNPDFFPDPEVYDPERFDPELEAARNPYTYLPFGDGPRNCIGLRFGMMQARIGLAVLLKSFRFEISDKTNNPLKFSVKAPILSVDGGIWFKVTKV
jgi:cytochrome P450 family 6